MKRTNALPLGSLLAVAIVASCAQGSSDTGGDAGAVNMGGSADSGVVGTNGNDSGGGANEDDSGTPSGKDDSGTQADSTTGGDDASEDTNVPGFDSGVVDSGNGGTDSGSVVPTTCAEADGKIGCCVGNEVYYCNPTFTKRACTGGQVCGWTGTFYDCVSPPGGSSSTYPIACN